jgi:hypothetical protein
MATLAVNGQDSFIPGPVQTVHRRQSFVCKNKNIANENLPKRLPKQATTSNWFPGNRTAEINI